MAGKLEVRAARTAPTAPGCPTAQRRLYPMPPRAVRGNLTFLSCGQKFHNPSDPAIEAGGVVRGDRSVRGTTGVVLGGPGVWVVLTSLG